MKKIFTAFLLLVSLMIQAQTTYYIDPAGSDATGNGTIGNPWKSLYKACASVKTSGDVIHVNAGTFVENSRSDLFAGVSIIGEGETSVIHSHFDSGSADDKNNALIRIYSSTQSVNGNNSISYIKFDGDSLTGRRAIFVHYKNHIFVHHCTFIDFNYSAIIFEGENSWSSLPPVYSDGNRIYNNTITNCNTTNGDGSIRITGQTDCEIYNNTVSQLTRGIGLTGQSLISGSNNKGTTIYNNTFYTPNTDDAGGKWDFVFELWDNNGGVEIRNNVFHGGGTVDMGGHNVRKGSYPFAVSVHDNEFLMSSQQLHNDHQTIAICIETWGNMQDVYVYNNYINNFANGIQVTFGNADYSKNSTCDNVYIYNNLIKNCGYSDVAYGNYAIDFVWQKEVAHFKNINIFNNDLIGGNGHPYKGIRWCNTGANSDVSIRNNIVTGFPYGPIVFTKEAGISTLDNLQLNHNLFFYCGTNAPVWGALTPSNSTVTPNYSSNPLFVSTLDFHLQGTSPAIGAGISVGLTTDKDGVNWYNPPSIGAYEYLRSNTLPSIKDQGFQLNQNSPDGTVVGTVIATDPDAGQALNYSIVSGNTNGAFNINALTGVLSVANSTALADDFSLVIKVQDDGIGELTNQATISIDVILTGVEPIGDNGTIQVYPNPVSDELIIEMEGGTDRTGFEILSSNGQIVFKGFLTEKTVVKTSGFTRGIYFLKIENRNTFEFKKFIKL
jgi:hypothetical protein